MHNNIDLPFERGSTYFEGDAARITTTNTAPLLGRTFKVCDNEDGFGSGLVLEKTLIILRNGSSGSLTQGYGVRFDTTVANTFHRIAKSAVKVQGDYGLAIDDAYAAAYEIKANDLFYAVLQGPNKSLPAADTASARILGGAAVTWDATGRLEPAAANDAITAKADAGNTNTNTTTRILVHHVGYSNH